MSARQSITTIGLCLAALASVPALAFGGDYRGMSAGWPSYSNGYYAANYPANYAAGPAYYVARPVVTAGYAARPAAGTMYMPVTAAYANPTYYGAYGRSPVTYRPVSTVGYAPAAGAYYAPVTANYAPSNSYAASPAGIGAGSEAATYLGQPTSLNYVPPRITYRPTYMAVPVYAYRPVTAYDPVTAQPVTCLQASTCNPCQSQPQRCFSLLNPFTWFGSSSSCGSGGCGSAPRPTTSYCGPTCGPTGCGQPYYPTQPLTPAVPLVPGPTVIPAQPRIIGVPPTTTIPPPPTNFSRGVQDPASIPPSLGPRTITPAPGGFGPGATTPLPSNPIPGQPSFPTNPGIQPGFQPGAGTQSFGTGANFPPAIDPYGPAAPLTPVGDAPSSSSPAIVSPPMSASPPAGPGHSVFGSGYRGNRSSASDGQVIRAPDLGPALPPTVETVPDLDAPQTPRPVNSAPQLLDPRDKTAARDSRWGVVPALWPKKEPAPRQLSERPVVATRAHESRDVAANTASPYVSSQPNPADYDDRGWKSAR